LMQRGFTRLWSDGRQIDLASPEDYRHPDFENVFVMVDRLIARPDIRERLVDSLETCFREGHGQALIELADRGETLNPTPASRDVAGRDARELRAAPLPLLSSRGEGRTLRFSENFECKYDGTVYAHPEPRLFSFNSPFGACPTCQGFGNTIGLDI